MGELVPDSALAYLLFQDSVLPEGQKLTRLPSLYSL